MGNLTGKVAFISGVARGQGRSHAVRLASEGADIIGIDICEDISTMDYPNSQLSDLEETVRLVEATGRKIIASQVDVRDAQAVESAVNKGVAELGRLDIVLSNAGIIRLGAAPEEMELQLWEDTIAVDLSGAYHVVRACVPKLIDGGNGGVIILTGSIAATRPIFGYAAGQLAYTAAKMGLVGMGRQLAHALAEHGIRVNVIHPTGVASGMTENSTMERLAKEAAEGGRNSISDLRNALDVEILAPSDISDAVSFLVSDQAKWITGVSLPVDAGFSLR
ncbi:mycofactocin-coupled SDR family oxidoreductase [Rhodococcus sp. 14C212]|uniref:mycofactocin-coupled SDR family oxidoreductase n=1 Tax=Rhodococcus sp. 14C212 TaxID=2711209 RepID=UPI0013ED02D7|nr:mycofactocin-coupled SDR family oxidoreductase [Rhodococcus sp. 14C212]